MATSHSLFRISALSGAMLCIMPIYANQATQTKALMQVIHQQQKQLQAQAKALQRERVMLERLERKVAAIEPHSEAKASSSSKNGGVAVSYDAVKPSALPLLERAGSSEHSTNLDSRTLKVGSKKDDLSLSGQINALGMYVDDGNSHRTYFGTNSKSDSRLNIDSAMQINPDVTVGSKLQLGFDVNPTGLISQTSTSSSIDIRKAELYMSSKLYGDVFLGQGNTASDDTANVDLSGTEIAGSADVSAIGGGMYFDNNTANPAVANSFVQLDGLSRKMRVRYDTPSWNGLVASGSLINGGDYDAAIKYAKQWGDTEFAAEAAYTSMRKFSTLSNAVNGHTADLSASVLSHGWNFTTAVGKMYAKDAGRKNPEFFYIKPGYQLHYFNAGVTALSIDYGRYYNFMQNNDVGTVKGVQLLQNLNKWDLALYASYRQFKLQRSGSHFNNINVVAFGALYKF